MQSFFLAVSLSAAYIAMWRLLTLYVMQLYIACLAIAHIAKNPDSGARFETYDQRNHFLWDVQERAVENGEFAGVLYFLDNLDLSIDTTQALVVLVWPLWILSVFRAVRQATRQQLALMDLEPISSHAVQTAKDDLD